MNEQPVFKIHGDVLQRWWNIGLAKGLADDTAIASFLLDQFELSQSHLRPVTYCVHCCTPLALYCVTCQLHLQQTQKAKATVPSTSEAQASTSDIVTNETLHQELSHVERSPVVSRIGEEDIPSDDTITSTSNGSSGQTDADLQSDKLSAQHLESRRNRRTFSCDLGKGTFTLAQDLKKHLRDHQFSEIQRKEEQNRGVFMRQRPDCGAAGEDNLKNRRARARKEEDVLESQEMREIPSISVFPLKSQPEVETSKKKQKVKVAPVSKRSTCKECHATFRDSPSLKIHVRTHQGIKPYVCDVCGHGFRQSAHLSRHRRLHTGVKPHKCGQCGEAFRWLCMLQSHRAKHTGIYPHVCQQCGRGFLIPSALRKHMLTHSGEKPFKCSDCEASFCQAYQLKTHWQVNHSGEKPYKCPDCDAAYSNRPSLTNHRKKHQQKDLAASKKEYVCHICGSAFMNASQLKAHMRSHSDVRAFTCKYCKASFKYPCYTHMKRCGQETDDKSFVCTTCGSQFSSRWSLKVHTSTHTGENRSRCDVCSMEFNSPQGLTIHMRKHSGERPFVCDQCGKSFISSSNLYSHRMTHNRDKPLKCTECEARFTWKFQIKAHMVVHTGEKSFVCSVCNASFPRSSSLKVHFRLKHTGEKPYLCSLCNCAFAMSRSLKKHKLMEHNSGT